MLLRFAALPLIVVGMLGGFLPTTTQAKSPPVVARPASPEPAALAAPVAPTPTVPVVATQLFGDWTYRCQDVTEAGKPTRSACEIFQDMVVRQADKAVPIMTVALTAEAAGRPYTATVLAPLGVLLNHPVTLSVDDGSATTLDYQFCGPRGCFARGPVPLPLLEQIKHGKQGHAVMVVNDGRSVTVNFGLSGTADALAAFEMGKAPVTASVPAAK